MHFCKLKPLLAGVAGAALLASSAQGGASPAGAAAGAGAVPPEVTELLADTKTYGPGCILAASKNGRLTLNRATGMSDIQHGLPMHVDTRLEAGSVTKQFTAAAMISLALEGKVSLSDDVRKYVPELPARLGPITIDDMLTHRSGIREWSTLGFYQGWGPYNDRRHYTLPEVVKLVVRQSRLNFEPGTEFSYSNSNYVLAATIIERVTGKSLAAVLKERFLDPLGMSHSALRVDRRAPVQDIGYAYRMADGSRQVFNPTNDVYGPGGLFTTPEDLIIWTNALEEGRVDPRIVSKLQEESVLKNGKPSGYGRGLFIGTYKGLREISHGGVTAGYETTLLRYPDKRVVVAVQCNGLEANTSVLAHTLANSVLGLPGEIPQKSGSAIELSPSALTAFAGEFVSDADGSRILAEVRDGKLFIRDREAVALTPRQFLVGGQVLVTFDDMDRATVKMGSKTFVIRRASASRRMTPAQLRQFEGIYEVPDVAQRYRARVVDGVLVMQLLDGPDFQLDLVPAADGTLRNDQDPFKIVRGKSGAVTGLLANSWGVRDLLFRRVSQAPHRR